MIRSILLDGTFVILRLFFFHLFPCRADPTIDAEPFCSQLSLPKGFVTTPEIEIISHLKNLLVLRVTWAVLDYRLVGVAVLGFTWYNCTSFLY
jgi:hypothetical protein